MPVTQVVGGVDYEGGPDADVRVEPLGPEVVVELEPEEQLPELPLTPD